MPARTAFVDNYFNIFRLWFPAIFASLGLALSMFFSFWCVAVGFEASNDLPTIRLGPWVQEGVEVDMNGIMTTTDSCERFGSLNSEIDATWKTARAFSLITAIVGSVVTFDLWMVHFAGIISDIRWNAVALLITVFLSFSQGMTFLLLRSNACSSDFVQQILQKQGVGAGTVLFYQSDCSWDNGSTANVAGIILWLCTGLVMLAMGPPRLPEHEPQRQAMEREMAERGEADTVVSE